MATELISFRLSNTELDWLREQCKLGESLNLAAKRLLLSLSQGVNSSVNSVDSRVNSGVNSVDSSVNSVDTSDVEEKFKQLQLNLDERLTEIEERLGKLKA